MTLLLPALPRALGLAPPSPVAGGPRGAAQQRGGLPPGPALTCCSPQALPAGAAARTDSKSPLSPGPEPLTLLTCILSEKA